ncbi:MAG: D-alanine aminotransferase [Bacteroidota bacterium]|jgi:branched-chain amino acid aminotransferase
MVNFNGILSESDLQLNVSNRSFLYGDGVFETMKVVDRKILFFEDHYFRLMASMRIIRMDIPMAFTMEYLEAQILDLVEACNVAKSARVRFTVYRELGGYYTPMTNSVSFVIVASKLDNKAYQLSKGSFEVDLYKDFVVTKQLLSTLKTNNKIIQVTAGIFAIENQLDSCLMINEDKNVVESVYGNLFMRMGDRIITPPISEGCLNGVMRMQVIRLIKKSSDFAIVEESISPFDLQKADELFITNVVVGVQPITKYRKKEFEIMIAKDLVNQLNNEIIKS